ncbi:hypothetical protein CALVIDRAFT_366916 [Calocera viscosa TUFC12733]|uniref:Uncharacterized protein n=1 Tax=Calocera viscosa (strain TUFC12733) TaxID=1330018 RepID=A0A167H1F1_CALVF|nr:hypothetical protein CALVIDRAFT_366916 [Calocera viscosa TUFC12733]
MSRCSSQTRPAMPHLTPAHLPMSCLSPLPAHVSLFSQTLPAMVICKTTVPAPDCLVLSIRSRIALIYLQYLLTLPFSSAFSILCPVHSAHSRSPLAARYPGRVIKSHSYRTRYLTTNMNLSLF